MLFRTQSLCRYKNKASSGSFHFRFSFLFRFSVFFGNIIQFPFCISFLFLSSTVPNLLFSSAFLFHSSSNKQMAPSCICLWNSDIMAFTMNLTFCQRQKKYKKSNKQMKNTLHCMKRILSSNHIKSMPCLCFCFFLFVFINNKRLPDNISNDTKQKNAKTTKLRFLLIRG